MPFLASDVMDEAAAILNDTGKNLYSNTAQLPYVKKANRELEQLLLIHGAPVQRVVSAVITVPAITPPAMEQALILPNDFLLPIRLFERNAGDVNDPWVPIIERMWSPENEVQIATAIRWWNFKNNAVYLYGCTQSRDVLLEYDRQLAVITAPGSAEDTYLSFVWLSARTAELCARYVGMNETIADGIRDNDVAKAEDSLLRLYVLNQQGIRQRRPRFRSQRLETF